MELPTHDQLDELRRTHAEQVTVITEATIKMHSALIEQLLSLHESSMKMQSTFMEQLQSLAKSHDQRLADLVASLQHQTNTTPQNIRQLEVDFVASQNNEKPAMSAQSHSLDRLHTDLPAAPHGTPRPSEPRIMQEVTPAPEPTGHSSVVLTSQSPQPPCYISWQTPSSHPCPPVPRTNLSPAPSAAPAPTQSLWSSQLPTASQTAATPSTASATPRTDATATKVFMGPFEQSAAKTPTDYSGQAWCSTPTSGALSALPLSTSAPDQTCWSRRLPASFRKPPSSDSMHASLRHVTLPPKAGIAAPKMFMNPFQQSTERMSQEQVDSLNSAFDSYSKPPVHCGQTFRSTQVDSASTMSCGNPRLPTPVF